jgi:hypothetical protein
MRFAWIAGLAVVCLFAACSSSSSDNPQAADAGDDQLAPPPPPPNDGGDSGPPSLLYPRGGSRIVARYHDLSDGARFFAQYFDKKLGTACFPQLAEDSMIRCLPSSSLDSTALFSDGTCTTRLAYAPKASCDAHQYVIESTAGIGFCAPKHVAYPIASTTPATTFFEKDPGGACIAATPSPDGEYFPIGAKIAPSEFVAFTEANEPIAGGVSIHVLAGEDGSRATVGYELFDDKRGKGCQPAFGSDKVPRCIPSGLRAFSFGDPGCTQRVAFDDHCEPSGVLTDPSVAVALIEPVDQCAHAFPSRVFPTGAVRTSHDVWFGTPAACNGPTVESDDHYDLGPEIAPATFPELTFGKVGGSRIVAETFGAGGTSLVHFDPIDAKEGISCIIDKATDGVLRCLPIGPSVGLFFSDDKCTVPLAAGDETCEPTKYLVTFQATCGAGTRVNAAGTRIESASSTFFTTIGGPCAQFVGSTSKYLWSLGPEVAPATFVDAKLVDR